MKVIFYSKSINRCFKKSSRNQRCCVIFYWWTRWAQNSRSPRYYFICIWDLKILQMLLTLDHLEIRKWSFTYQFYSISPRNYVVGVSKKVAEPLRYFQPYEKNKLLWFRQLLRSIYKFYNRWLVLIKNASRWSRVRYTRKSLL